MNTINGVQRARLLLMALLLSGCDRAPDIPYPPGADLVFRKYYPANEIAGLAADQRWREVRTSTQPRDALDAWYDQHFSHWPQVENRRDVFCSHKTWQQPPSTFASQIVICDHGSYRTVLAIVPP